MRRKLLVYVTVVLLATLTPVSIAADDQQQAATRQVWELIRESRDLVNEGRLDEAEATLEQACALSPDYTEVYAHLGYVYELREKPSEALHAYAELLRRRPKHEYAASRLENLFYEGLFPRAIFPEDLQFSPIQFVLDHCKLTIDSLRADDSPQVTIAYTDDLLFHEDMERSGPPVEIRVPASPDGSTALVNRSTYGFVADSSEVPLQLKFALNYPSRLISPNEVDHRSIAPKVMHLLLRAHVYFARYLGKLPPVELPVKSYLLEMGPPGAESYGNELFFYSTQISRSPVEWARQVGHEYGHLVLPPVGRYMEPESWANGMLGERLFIQWLAEEAQSVSGATWPDPVAVERLNGLLGKDAEFDACGYLDASCYADMRLWQQLGPDSAHIADTGEEAMRYWLGLMLWIQASLGKDVLRDVIDSAPGTSPSDFLYALKVLMQQQATVEGIRLSVGGIDVDRSCLSTPPAQGALGWGPVQLDPGDSATLIAYMPGGVWQLRTTPSTVGLEATCDGRGPVPINPEGGMSLGAVNEGWHTIGISSQTAQVQLKAIELELTDTM